MTNGGPPFTLEFNMDDFHQFTDLVKQVYSRATKLLSEDLWANIGKEAPTDHGKLAGGWLMEPINDFDWRVYTMVKYALWVHEGTGIYGPTGAPITPVSAPALAFDWKGQHFVLRSVKGQKANPYVDRAMEKTKTRIQEFVLTAIDQMAL